MPREPDEPTPSQVLEEMQVCEPYTVSDFESIFDDTSRWTIQRRLEALRESGQVEKKKHAENRVTWWVSANADWINGFGAMADIEEFREAVEQTRAELDDDMDKRIERHFEKIRRLLDEELSEE